jgi:hypothetical protein
MNETEKRLARQFAANIVELERRNDFGALLEQANQDFTEQVFVWHGTRKAYRLPDGTATPSHRAAVLAWAEQPAD